MKKDAESYRKIFSVLTWVFWHSRKNGEKRRSYKTLVCINKVHIPCLYEGAQKKSPPQQTKGDQ